MMSPSNVFDKYWPSNVQWVTELFVPVEPVPASRPRVGRYGAYYSGPYQKFRRLVPDILEQIKINKRYDDEALVLKVVFVLNQPNSTSLNFPDPDIDNYEKGIYDQLNSVLWYDDSRIVAHAVCKVWQDTDEIPEGIYLVVGTYGNFKKETKRKDDRSDAVSQVQGKRRRLKRGQS